MEKAPIKASPCWKGIPAFSHLRHYAKEAFANANVILSWQLSYHRLLKLPIPWDKCVSVPISHLCLFSIVLVDAFNKENLSAIVKSLQTFVWSSTPKTGQSKSFHLCISNKIVRLPAPAIENNKIISQCFSPPLRNRSHQQPTASN